jgi:recombination protein RecT
MSELEEKLEQRAQQQAIARPGNTVLALLTDPKIKEQLTRSLPSAGITVDRLLRVALTEVRRNPKLAECTQRSILGSLMIAAQLGLEPGGPLGQFYLVPFKNHGVSEVTPILGYKGMITLARRSGELASIVARAVYSADYFDFSWGLEDRLVHRPKLDGDRGKIIAFYGVARMVNGGVQSAVLSKADVDKYRGRSRASEAGPWVSDYEQMGAKTVIRRMSPYLPLTAEAAAAVVEDEDREEGRRDAAEALDITPIELAEEPVQGQQEEPKEPDQPKRRTRSRTAGAEVEKVEPVGTIKGEGGEPDTTVTRHTPVAETQEEHWSCPICGTTDSGHHIDEKHVEWAANKRREKEQQEKQSATGELPLKENQ